VGFVTCRKNCIGPTHRLQRLPQLNGGHLRPVNAHTDPKGLRDRAALRLLFDLALRRGEVVGLDAEDLDLAGGTVAVRGKGRMLKVRLTMPAATRAALAAWMAVRGPGPGPLFVSLDQGQPGGRLSGTGLYLVVRDLGRKVGLRTWPHAIRHSAITAALDATGGDVRRVEKFSRHRKLDTLLLCDDRRKDDAGSIAQLVAGGMAGNSPATGAGG
jgi:integrase/recombinase XerC